MYILQIKQKLLKIKVDILIFGAYSHTVQYLGPSKVLQMTSNNGGGPGPEN